MNWLLLAFSGPLLWAASTHIDKYLVENYFKNVGVGALLIFTSLIGLLGLPIIAVFADVMVLGPTGIAVTAFSGLLYLTAMYFYLQALQGEEASIIAPLFQTSPLFVYGLAYVVLGEALSLRQLAGGLLVLLSAVFVSFEPGGFSLRRFKPKTVGLMVACAFALALSSVIFKFFAVRDAFWPTTFWTFAGEAVLGAILLAVPSIRRQFFALFRKHPGAMMAINGANELINLGGGLAARFASLLGPVALVQAISGTTSLFVFLFGVLLSLFLPKWGQEDLSRRSLLQKGIAVALIVSGVILIGGNTSQ